MEGYIILNNCYWLLIDSVDVIMVIKLEFWVVKYEILVVLLMVVLVVILSFVNCR